MTVKREIVKIQFNYDFKTWGFYICFRSYGGGLYNYRKVIFHVVILCFQIALIKDSKTQGSLFITVNDITYKDMEQFSEEMNRTYNCNIHDSTT